MAAGMGVLRSAFCRSRFWKGEASPRWERRGASNLRQREGEGGQHSVKEDVFPTRSWEKTVVLRRRTL